MSLTTCEVPLAFRAHCVHAPACPGCPLIRDCYGEQLTKKALRVRAAAGTYPELGRVVVAETRAAEQVEGYRTRAKLVADARGALGLFARGSHELVDLPGCLVLHPALAQAAAALRPLSAGGELSGVDLALVDDAVMVTLIAPMTAAREPLVELARALAKRAPAVKSVAISRRRPGAVQLLGAEHEVVLGPPELRARAGDVYHYAAHGAFQQVHTQTAAALYARVGDRLRAAAEGSARVLELYAGSGAFSLALAKQGSQVLAVESFAPACERLARAAREQALSLEVRQGDAGAVARTLAESGARFELVVVNPPRRGLDVQVRTAIAQLAPAHVGYVSCNPETLARDLAHWARLGWLAADALEPFDMMPLTDQVETFAWLSRRAPAPIERLAIDQAFEGDLLAVAKGPHQDVERPQGLTLHVPTLLDRVRASPGYEQALPWLSLDASESGVCLFARDARSLARLRQAFAGGHASYQVLARGVLHKRGKLARARAGEGPKLAEVRYARSAVERGHSLLRCEVPLGAGSGGRLLCERLARIGHPVIGDRRHDRATRTHFEMRHGLDRAFIHRAGLVLEVGGRRLSIEAPLAPDFEGVLASLRERLSGA